jgi:membrane fusion protein (multidrug efflux system)
VALQRQIRAALSALCLTAACNRAAPPPPAPPPLQVGVVTLAPRPATVTNEYVGELEAFNTVEIRPRVGGLLEKQLVADGARVKKGDVLFTIDKQPFAAALSAANAALLQARAAVQRSERDLQRIEPLGQINAVSQQELDQVRTGLETNRAAVEAAEAEVKTARLNLDYTTITAPISGTLGRVQIRQGSLLTAYQSLLTTLYANDPMYVNFSISERRLLELQRELGSVAKDFPRDPRFTLVLADGSEYERKAALDFVDPAVDQQTGTLAVRLDVPNPEQRLLSGQFVRVIVPAAQIPDALLLPQRAVQERQGETFVYVVADGNKAEERPVVMGARIGGDWLVESGLKAGDRVIADGAQKLKTGAVVVPKPAMTAEARRDGG